MKNLLALVVVLAAACGGKSTQTTTPTSETTAETTKPEMPAEVVKFHDVLAPKWHAEKGEQRMKDTCAVVAELQVNAEAIAKVTPPTGADASKWANGSKELTDAVMALDTTCKSNDTVAFEPAFERVHNGFHAVMEASMEGGKSAHMHKDGEQCEHGEMHAEGHEGHEGHEAHDAHAEMPAAAQGN
ncbi:MAG: hypothetical protein AB7P03_02185 [Kofleriaceae bacterium]